MRPILLATLALALAAPASATVYIATLTGNAGNITDNSGVFGTPGAHLTAVPFTAVFKIDTAGGKVLNTPTGISSNSAIDPNPAYAVAGAITIGGTTFSTIGNNYSSAFITPGGTGSVYQLTSADAPNSSANLNISLEIDGAGLPATLTAPITLDLTQPGFTYAQIGFIDYNADGTDALGTLTPTSLSVAVPEPGMIALLGVGLGSIALRVRRRR